MSDTFVRYDVKELTDLVGQLVQAADDYSANYQKLTSLIQNITSGTMTGPVAEELKRLYEDKKTIFDGVETFVENNRELLQRKTIEGQNTIDEVKGNYA